jgi:bifunctional N-acetylglutamate synthase/kinase
VTSTQELIVQLLRNLGSKKEVEQYLKQFSSVDSRKFAVIQVGGSIIAQDLEGLASSLTFLTKVGLTPIVVHGAGPQLDEALREAGLAAPGETDSRTSRAALEVTRRVFRAENLRLVDALEDMGTRARPITSGVFEAELVDEDRLGYVGHVTRVHAEAIDSSMRSGHLPVLAALGESSSGQILSLPTNTATRQLALHIGPFKIVILSKKGGMLDEVGDVLPAVNLDEDYESLGAAPLVLPRGPRTASSSARPSSRACRAPRRSPSPHRTTWRRSSSPTGAQAPSCGAASGSSAATASRMWTKSESPSSSESSFGRKLVPTYFEDKPIFRVYHSTSYRAAAILTHEVGVPYLDKFAVTAEAQGEGIGGSLWLRLARENGRLFWRSRNENEVNPWYFQRADGSYSNDEWTVFWYGLRDFGEIEACVRRALSMPPTLKQHSIGG